ASGNDFVHYSGCKSQGVGHADFRRRKSGDRGQLIEDLFQREVLPAEDVTFATAGFFVRGNMAARAFSGINEIEPSINVSGKFLLQETHYDAAGGRRLDVALANGSCGIDDHNVLSDASRFNRNLLRHELGALVGTDHVVERDRGALVRGLTIGGESHRG